MKMSPREFIRDESGSLTVWLLAWLGVFFTFSGLAVDVTNAYRMRSLLQSTADMSSHAGAIELYHANVNGSGASQADIKVAASQMASNNLDAAVHQSVLNDSDIQTGTWDFGLRTFDPTTDFSLHNAVRVVARRSEVNDNAVPVSFLKIIEAPAWNITVLSITAFGDFQCEKSQSGNLFGFFTEGIIDSQSNNQFGDKICLYGEAGVEIQNGNRGGLDVPDGQQVGTTYLASPSKDNVTGVDGQDSGLEVVSDNIPIPEAADYIPPLLSGEIVETDADGNTLDENTDLALLDPGKTYKITCSPSGNGTKVFNEAPSGDVSDVTLLFDCSDVSFSADVTMIDTTVAMIWQDPTGGGAKSSLDFAAKGAVSAGACGSSVMNIFSYGDVKFASQADFEGLFMVIDGHLEVAAQLTSEGTLQVFAGERIDFTSNAEIFSCSGDDAGVALDIRRFQIVR